MEGISRHHLSGNTLHSETCGLSSHQMDLAWRPISVTLQYVTVGRVSTFVGLLCTISNVTFFLVFLVGLSSLGHKLPGSRNNYFAHLGLLAASTVPRRWDSG